MSIEAIVWAWDQNLPPTCKLLLAVMANQADERDGAVKYGRSDIAHIAAKAGLSQRHVFRMIRALERNGYVLVVSGKGKGRASQYWLLLDREPTPLEDFTWRDEVADEGTVGAVDEPETDEAEAGAEPQVVPGDVAESAPDGAVMQQTGGYDMMSDPGGYDMESDPGMTPESDPGMTPESDPGMTPESYPITDSKDNYKYTNYADGACAAIAAPSAEPERPPDPVAARLDQVVSRHRRLRRFVPTEQRAAVGSAQATAPPGAENRVFVLRGSKAWNAWLAHRRDVERLTDWQLPTTSGPSGMAHRTGWYCPSLFPPRGVPGAPAAPPMPRAGEAQAPSGLHFVEKGTPEWSAWCAHKRRDLPTTTGPNGRQGWYFPSPMPVA